MRILISLLAAISVQAARYVRSNDYHWTYADNGASWPDNVESCNGDRQSPIDIPTQEHSAQAPKVDFAFEGYNDKIKWSATNNGHAIQLNVPETPKLAVTGGKLDGGYTLAQFHFHWGSEDAPGSEHLIGGKRHFAEIHLVHFKEAYGDIGTAVTKDDGLAVLGFFVDVDESAEEGALDKLIKESIGKNLEAPKSTISVEESMNNILNSPDFDNYYRYLGGLTTPTCNEVVVWTVFEKPITIAKSTREMMASFADDTHDVDINLNYREAQELGKRLVTFYSSSVTEEIPMPDHAEETGNSTDHSNHNMTHPAVIDYDDVHVDPEESENSVEGSDSSANISSVSVFLTVFTLIFFL